MSSRARESQRADMDQDASAEDRVERCVSTLTSAPFPISLTQVSQLTGADGSLGRSSVPVSRPAPGGIQALQNTRMCRPNRAQQGMASSIINIVQ